MHAIVSQVWNSIIEHPVSLGELIKLKHINRIVYNYNSLVSRRLCNNVFHQSACALEEASLTKSDRSNGLNCIGLAAIPGQMVCQVIAPECIVANP